MTELASPSAKRLQRPSWRDSRLVVGVLLVVVAATLGAKAVASADDRVPVWVAASNLVAGDEVAETSFVRADVRLADGMNAYLAADAPAPTGSFMVRDVRAGELVPVSAVGGADAVAVQRVTVRADAMSTTGLARGSRVDVFVTPKAPSTGDTATTTPTKKVLESAAVAAVMTSSGGFGAGSMTSVQIYVPADKVQPLVEAVDGEAKLTLVPSVGAVTGGGA
ncbi:hypothetical protein [Terrabacter sp. Ter38]|uniref:hypothetical protein n=1 Tax=Terrabacter sp. Ter38 TaxID=2926030 RepID=UPI002118F51B|nr:hypothetical protein [Terrabacter sp. Ter38]